MLYTALVAFVIHMAHLGLGKHSQDLGGGNRALTKLFKFIYISEIFYNTVTLLVKIAFICMFSYVLWPIPTSNILASLLSTNFT